MSDVITRATFFTNLDTIFDMRAAVLAGMGGNSLQTAIQGGYYTRARDYFPGVNNEEFTERYKNRSASDLKNAVITNIVTHIKHCVAETLKKHISGPHSALPVLIVNYYPYKLSDETVTAIADALIAITQSCASVSMVSMPLNEITPQWVKNEISVMFIYDWIEWIEYHSKTKALETVTCPEVMLVAPRIYFKEPKPTEIPNGFGSDIFTAAEDFFGCLVGLHFEDISEFSLAVTLE